MQVEVLSAENGRAVDDVHVRVHDTAHLDRLTLGLQGTPGVVVEGVLQSPPPVTGHAELELVARLVQQPARALHTLVDGVPAAIGADWAAVLSGRGEASRGALDVVDTVELGGIRAPDLLPGLEGGLPLRVGSPRVQLADGRAALGSALVPIGSDTGPRGGRRPRGRPGLPPRGDLPAGRDRTDRRRRGGARTRPGLSRPDAAGRFARTQVGHR